MNTVEDLASQRIQTSIATSFMRETETLGLARRHLRGPRPRILSFGCSAGLELATLRVLFPQGEILGCDVDEHALRVAQANVGHFAEVFHSSTAAIAARGPYDMICAFSSLCINPFPGLEKLHRQFPFSRFEELLAVLDAQLLPGGLLCLQNTIYPFGATAAARCYDPVRKRGASTLGFVALAHPAEGMVLAPVKTAMGRLLRIGNTDGITDWDLLDSVFLKRAAGEAPQVRWHETPRWSRGEEFATPFASWRTSNLDHFLGEDREGLFEIVDEFRAYRSVQDPTKALVEVTLRRRTLHSPTLVEVSTRGRLVTAAAAEDEEE